MRQNSGSQSAEKHVKGCAKTCSNQSLIIKSLSRNN